MTIDDRELRRRWLALEQIVGDSGFELWDEDDRTADLAAHEPSEAELRALAATVTPEDLATQRAAVDELIRQEWQRGREARETRPMRAGGRVSAPATASRVDLLAMVTQLRAAHPGQFAQHYRNLDELDDDTLRALVEDMLALADDEA